MRFLFLILVFCNTLFCLAVHSQDTQRMEPFHEWEKYSHKSLQVREQIVEFLDSRHIVLLNDNVLQVFDFRNNFELKSVLSLDQAIQQWSATFTGKALYLAGLPDGQTQETTVVRRIDFDAEQLSIRPLPDLPDTLFNPKVCVVDNRLYLVGANSGPEDLAASNPLYVLDLADGNASWERLANSKTAVAGGGLLVSQYDGRGYSLFWIGNKAGQQKTGSQSIVQRYDIEKGVWDDRVYEAPVSLLSQGVPSGINHILVWAQDEVGQYYAYNCITNVWSLGPNLPLTQHPQAIFKDSNDLWITSSNEDGLSLWEGRAPKFVSSMHWFDYGVIGLYFVLLIAMGKYFSRKEKNSNDYFRGGQRVPGWASGISMLGTSFSAISFLSLPAKSYATDWLYLSNTIGTVLIVFIAIWLVVPVYYRMNLTSTYEYLENRFDSRIRVFASAIFSIIEIFRMGALVLLPSVVLSYITGINLYLCVVLIGIVATAYTVMGGIEAVVWTDVIQVFIMIGGILLGIAIVFYTVPVSAVDTFSALHAEGKLRLFNWSMDFSEPAMILVLLFLVMSPGEFARQQHLVQRLMSTGSEKAAKRSLLVKALLGPVMLLLMFLMGTCIFIFYQTFPEKMSPAVLEGDHIFPIFIVRELPIGISGLLIGSVFAAAMSSLDSSLSGSGAVIITDYYKRFFKVKDEKLLKQAKILTILLGFIGTTTALIYATFDIKSLFDSYMTIFMLLAGSLAGVFWLGLMTRRTHTWGLLLGIVASAFTLYYLRVHTDIHFFHYGVIGGIVCIFVGYVASIIIPSKPKNLDGLTIYTKNK